MARGRMRAGAHLVALLLTLSISFFRDVDGQQASFNDITGFSLSPPYFNLAEGARISATATCGQDQNERARDDLYCKLVGGPNFRPPTQNVQGSFCDYCNANDPSKAHPVTNAIDGTERWWQSPPLSRGLVNNEVNVTLDLGQLFHVAYVLIKFANSPRPDLWALERSVDDGRTYSPWQYFAHSKRECIEKFGKEPNLRIVRDDDQICYTEYSRIVPLENGEIVVSLVNGRPGSKNFTYSPVLRDFTKATNIRLRFLRTSTLLGHLISKAQRDPTVTRRYYYSIKDISVGGRCVCHGHAQVCGGRNQDSPNRRQCECTHNTCGESCDRCCPGFNQKPWRAATADSPNECQPCQCFSHAFDCYYDPEVEQKRTSLDTFARYDGGGVCINCQHNTAGVNCDKCVEGFYRPYGLPTESHTGCIPCRCDGRTTAGCEMGSGRCICKPQFTGGNCDRCADGYYGYPPQCIRGYPQTTTKSPSACLPGYFGPPSCQRCVCDDRGSVYEVCDASGRCLCRRGVEGERCDRCRPGYHTFPSCQECRCDGAGAAGTVCDPSGQCSCLANYQGQQCDQCAPGYYGYPDCAACQCSREGSYGTTCNPLSGQCLQCLPGVVGQMCDRCASGLQFPQCSASIRQCNPAGSEVINSQTPDQGSCRCLPNVEGPQCDRCKPLYWNLATDHPSGCIECQCDVKGTLSGVGECQQKNGQCFCKPNACGHSCDTCKHGYFLVQKRNYFGCEGCQCDVGGAIGRACDDMSGQCRCRNHIVGRTCTEPATGFYFPSLHQLKYEVENGITPNSRPVRFGFDPRNFPAFSWRGYAIMSPAQTEVRVTVHVDVDEARQPLSPLFRVVLRFANPSGTNVSGSVKATNNRGAPGSGQSQEVVFPVSTSPTFLTVPGDGFAQPFSLTPGKWVIHIQAQGILLDYLVLLPRDYYEAPLLQEKITQPCTYTPAADRDTNCLLYKHVSMDGFSSALGTQGKLSNRGGRRKRQVRVRRPTPDHPEMASVSGTQAQLQLGLRVSRPGPYALVLEYASEVDTVQNVNLLVNGQSDGEIQARANVYSCAYSFLCRSVAVDSSNRVAVFQLTHKDTLLLQSSTASFLLHKVFAVPAEEFFMEYVNPKILCVSVHGRFTGDSQHCIPSQFTRPAASWLLDAARDGQPSSPRVVTPQQRGSEEWRRRRQLPLTEPQSEGVLLKSPQTEISFNPTVPLPGRYVVVVHYRQPEHISVPVEVRVDTGRTWNGSINASFCPSVSGCREVVIAERRIALDFERHSWREPIISVKIPPGKTLTLDYVLVVRDNSYAPDLLKPKPLDNSADFIQHCRGEGFYIDPRNSSEFCRDSARSLVAAYNGGAVPCNCDQSGSTGSICDPNGGQCPCRQHVIGRQCTKCATGYYGFPYCRSCECGRRLCDEVTGQCICPPQTIRPSCDVCEARTFSYHPLLGCEDCDCSPVGTRGEQSQTSAGPDCDRVSGQCTCKPRIGGRQCDRCAEGYYGFPNCVPCDCNEDGVTPDVCHPDTGKCLCKKHVVGDRCDACKDGAFHFDPSNPTGCTSCFCFGATGQCQSSSKHRGKFVEMRGWRLERENQEEVPSVLNSASNTVVADVQELPAVVHILHWVAPSSYLGDRVSSYGGFLTYQIKSFGIPSEGMTLLNTRPDVLLTGQDMRLVHQTPEPPSPDRLYQGRVQLVEGNWRHAGTSRPVSRDEMMTVLAGLAGLRIRALHFTQTQRLSLGDVGLEEATDTGAGSPASTVEKCACPARYSGDSCQKCAPGYYRDGSGPFLGRCVRCDCNGRADECDEKTGKCLNCQYDSAGDRCERCKEGYYGNPAQRTCRVCPCPFRVPTNSFAVGCREVSGAFQCICRTGYTGERCERCAPGFYGDPLTDGGSCQACDCNGNGNNCDSRTGVCKNTEPKDTNTDGQCKECDSCAQTLLSDLEKLDAELDRIKAQIDNATASATSQDRLKKLEKAIADTKILVNKFHSTINNQKPKVRQLEEDVLTLKDDINLLKDKANQKTADAKKAVADVEKTYHRAKGLDSEIKNMLRKIQALLDQLTEAGTSASGDSQLTDDLAKMLEEAQRMVKEMERRNFNPQKTAAEKERDEAKKLLEYVKANVSKQCDQNEAAAKKLRGLIKSYEAKLKDLEEALKEAGNTVKKANTQNGLNAQELEDLLKRIADLKKERDTVKDQIAIADKELQNTKDLLKMLADSQKEYEQLAAQLDGAKTDLTKKVNEISKAAAKEDIVRRAEEHARNLTKLAKDLQDAVRDSSGGSDVRDAMDAINAYKNITDAINAAEAAANEAKRAADKALDDVKKEDLVKRAQELKGSANDLLKDGKEAKTALQDAADDLSDQKRRLQNAEKKKKALEKDLLKAQTELNNIKRDDIADVIAEAKRKASSANDTASKTMDELKGIREEIDKINITTPDSNLSSVMDDVNESVKNLLNTIPSLEKKISEVENLSSEISPISNISESIQKIKELIEQARDAADRVVVPMKFSGNGHVELRPPSDLDDLKAYTSMSLSLQRDAPPSRGDGRRRRQASNKGDMFVLYLGNKDSSKDYIGMALRNNVLYCVYKLNGVETEIKSGETTPSTTIPVFDKVDLNRIYQDAKLILTKSFTNPPETERTDSAQGQETKNLLDLKSSEVVFYIGGYPADFTPPEPLKLPNYTGCIELFRFNDQSASLYNFHKAVNVNPEIPCKRYIPPNDVVYLEGNGYGRISIPGTPKATLRMSQSISSHSENGLLIYIGNEHKYYSVTIERGFIVIRSNLLPEPVKSDKKIFPANKQLQGSQVLVVIESGGAKEIKVITANAVVVTAKAEYTKGEFTEYYLGGAPLNLREKNNITAIPLKGCVRSININSDFKPFEEKVGISKGCMPEFLPIRKAEFNLGSSLSADLSGFSLTGDVTVSLGFKSTNENGLLLQKSQPATGIEIALEGGYVVLKSKDKVWKSKEKYQDGQWHYLTATKRAQRIELYIDDKDAGQQQSSRAYTDNKNSSVFLGKDTFKGCLSNLYMRRPDSLFVAEDLSHFDSNGDTLLDICTGDRPPQLMLDRNAKKR